jgi:hypothetical protein
MRHLAALAALLLPSLPAAAQDRQPCAAGLVCASKPDGVLQALARAGFKPKLAKDNDGDPLIEVEGEPYRFDVYFYGCEKNANCDSLRFEAAFEKDAEADAVLANKWNANHRFVSASVKADGRFVLSYDIGTIGGANARNFADTIDWWKSMLGEAADFFVKELKGKGA